MNEGTPSGPAAPGPDSPSKPLGDVIAINEGLIKDHLNKVVVKTVEETLNAMLEAEADQLCGVGDVRFALVQPDQPSMTPKVPLAVAGFELGP